MITVTSLAAEKIKGIKAAQTAPADAGLRIRVVGGGCSGFQYQLAFDAPKPDDQIIEQDGVTVLVDPKSFLYLSGTEIDYMDGLTGAGFTLKNPNAKGSCGCGSSFTA
ncbi:MAG: heme biosynthesis protein HemY [candidate division NC10 bacterium RIFCSPLOWO2_12_FULL_66_18]|nr:MAG: heme biosynthesis protein HemY [candidate division NC10 bacterium RIFCSPLOWO2_02_FULL_66_22]OGC02608.1 MAG: heme biosynthesis protein HemY [candidate division NC10 bacterium RIFCSPLOWO2_12_FULL_66_18]